MSILGYSSSYFLPQYWANTPLYGEKIIPLLDYMLSNEYEYSDKLAQAFYNITNKYQNTLDLPIEQLERIIDENGYSYIRQLLGDNEDSMRLLVSLMTLIHQLKGTKLGVTVVLNLLRGNSNIMTMKVVGRPDINSVTKEVSKFSISDYVIYNGLVADTDKMDLKVRFRTGNFNDDQCILSVADYGFYLGVDTLGRLIVSLSSNRKSWNIANNLVSSRNLSPNTEYYLRTTYDGYEYSISLSTTGNNYVEWFNIPSSKALGISNGALYLGVNAAEGGVNSPFSGSINFSNFSMDMSNIEISQWFEQTPVGDENTFIIKSELDLEVVSSDFFVKFSTFIKNYVYPSLSAFTAKLGFESNITLLPYARQKITYAAQDDVDSRMQFLVRITEDDPNSTEDYVVLSSTGGEDEEFEVLSKFPIISTVRIGTESSVTVQGNITGSVSVGSKVLLLGTSEELNKGTCTVFSITFNEATFTSKVVVSKRLEASTGGTLWIL